MADDPFERFSGGRDPAPEYVGIRAENLQQIASDRGVEDVRIVVREGWFGWTGEVVRSRLSVMVEDGKVLRAWWG